MIAEIPHEPPIRIVHNLDWVNWPSCSASITVPVDSPYTTNEGALCPEMFLEMMAQCFAGACGAKYGKRPGYLAGIRGFTVTGLAYGGDKLSVVCAMDKSIGDIWLVEGKVFKMMDKDAQLTLLASAQLRIYVPEEM